MIKHFEEYMKRNAGGLNLEISHYTIIPCEDYYKRGFVDVNAKEIKAYCQGIEGELGKSAISIIDHQTRTALHCTVGAVLALFNQKDIPTEKPNTNLEVQNTIKDVRSSINHLEELLTKMNVERG